MAHPFNALRQHKVERSRVSHIAGHAAGGAAHDDEAADKKLVRSMVKGDALKVGGAKSGARLDRYARGGKVGKKKGHTTVNVVVAGQGGDKQPMPVPIPAPVGAGAAPPPMPPRPPMPVPAGPAAPGMMPRRKGGRAYASGGAVSGRAWEEGKRNGTQISHSPGKNDGDKINTKPALLTRKRGGRAYPLSAGADSGEGRLQKARAQKRAT